MPKHKHACWIALAAILPLVLAGCPEDKNDPKTWIKKLKSPSSVEKALEELKYLQDPVAISALGETWKEYNHDTRVLRYVINLADQWDQGPLTVEQVCRKAYKPKENTCPDYNKKMIEERKQELYGKKYAKGPYWDYKDSDRDQSAFDIMIKAAGLFVKDKFSKTAMNNAETAVDAMRKAKLTYDALKKRDSNFNKEVPPKVLETLVQILSETADIDPRHPGQKVRLVTCRALGEFDSPEAVDALIGVLDKAEHPKSQHPKIFAAAADALGKIALKDQALASKATDALLLAMFAVPDVFQFTRRALVAIGPQAETQLIKVFEHKHPQVNAFAKANNFAKDCYGDGGDQYGYKSTCKAPSNLRYKAAMVLGDLHSKKALPILLSALHDRPVPAFFDPRGRSLPPTQHSAILEAIQKISSGDRSTSEKIKACWLGGPPKGCNLCNGHKCGKNMFPKRTHCRCYEANHAAALNTYSFIARSADDKVFAQLSKYIKAKGEVVPLALRFDAGISYGRLARHGRTLAPLTFMIVGNRKDAAEAKDKLKKAEAELKKVKAEETKEKQKLKAFKYDDVRKEKKLTEQLETANSVLEMEKTATEKLKKASKRRGKKKAKLIESLKKQLAAAKKAANKVRSEHKIAKLKKELAPLANTVTPVRKVVEKAEKKTKAADGKVKKLQGTVADLVSFERTFEYSLARAAVGMECGNKVDCYIDYIKRRRSEKVAKMIRDVLRKEGQYWSRKGGEKAKGARAALKAVRKLPEQIHKWKLDDRKALTLAVAERAALELAKLGKRAKDHTKALLTLLRTKEPFVRQALLIALLHVADKPCKACVKRLDELIERDSKSAAAVRLATEAKLWRSYFAWATDSHRGGGKNK